MYEIILRRSRGRFVKSARRKSKYAAKQLRDEWESKYDETYSVEIVLLKQEDT